MTRERTAQLARVGASYEVVTQSGGQLRFGDAADGGLSPMETLLATLAGCSAMDVHAIAAKKRQRLDRYVVTVVGQQRDEHPRIFIRIDVRHELEGQGLSETAVRRSIELSAGKYCPVNAMLAAGPAEIHHAYRIRGTDAEPWEAEGEVIVTGPGWPIAVASAEEMALEGLGEADLEARATEA